jgi:hypothetical protein
MNVKTLVAMLCGSIFLASTAYAQQSTGSLKGIVSGANADVVVEVVDNSRGITKSKTVDANGAFRFDGLTLGQYEVKVLSEGHVVDSRP